jgi:ribosomal protein S4
MSSVLCHFPDSGSAIDCFHVEPLEASTPVIKLFNGVCRSAAATMPVDYKLRTLRRLFGAKSFFRSQRRSAESGTAARAAGVSALKADGVSGDDDAATIEARASAAAAAETAAKVQAEEDLLYADFPERDDTAGMDPSGMGGRKATKRQSGGAGGVPRAFFHGEPPRSVRNKAVGGQLNIVHLFEKQKMRVYYGAMRDGRFKDYVDEARRARFNVDAQLMRLLELRLDTVLYRSGFVETPNQARQWISHNQILVNGSPMNVKSAQLQSGDVVSIRDRFVESAVEASARAAAHREKVGAGATWLPSTGAAEGMLPWMVTDRAGLATVLVRPPSDDEARSMCRAALYPYIRDAALNPTAAMRSYR